MKILILNGPNLNLTGRREPEIYGNQNFDELMEFLNTSFPAVEFIYHQTNAEGGLIDALHTYGFTVDGIILNAGAYAHTSIALGDAVKAIKATVIEVHMSNVFAREALRHTSFIAPHARASLVGFGIYGYVLAAKSLIDGFRMG
jgi:3-dehydroquinate dehydratase II